METRVIKAKNLDEAISELLKDEKIDKNSIVSNIKQAPSKGFLGIGAKDGIFEISFEYIKDEEAPVEDAKEEVSEESKLVGEVVVESTQNVTAEDEIALAKEFVEGILKASDINADVIVRLNENVIKVNIVGEEASCLIGRRGETLDSIQFLTGLALNKINKNSHTRVFVDIENYRSKREESLKRYCYKAAREVAKTRRIKKLDYMNPYERRIVHSALQNDKFVITYSEGTDPYRRVVIEPKNYRRR